jgi:hypothetical protein
MTIEAVIAYFEHAGVPAPGQEAAAVTGAREAGFSFSEPELRAALEAREVLVRVREDGALREEVIRAESPVEALFAIARRSGRELRRDAVLAVLGALRRGQGELGARELDRVAGGARTVLPEVDDEVLVTFAHGDTRAPYLAGSLWKSDKPPSTG